LLLGLARAVTLRSKSRRTHGLILLSQLRLHTISSGPCQSSWSWSSSCGRQSVDQYVWVSGLPLGSLTRFYLSLLLLFDNYVVLLSMRPLWRENGSVIYCKIASGPCQSNHMSRSRLLLPQVVMFGQTQQNSQFVSIVVTAPVLLHSNMLLVTMEMRTSAEYHSCGRFWYSQMQFYFKWRRIAAAVERIYCWTFL
jgi:hypothetical protein